MAKGHTLQDPFLNALRKERVSVAIYLVNGIKLQGQVESFDQFVVLLRNNNVSQMVYKHAISTVVPSRNVSTKPAHLAHSPNAGHGQNTEEDDMANADLSDDDIVSEDDGYEEDGEDNIGNIGNT